MNVIEAWEKAEPGQTITNRTRKYVVTKEYGYTELYPIVKQAVEDGHVTSWTIKDPEPIKHEIVIEDALVRPYDSGGYENGFIVVEATLEDAQKIRKSVNGVTVKLNWEDKV